MHCRLVYGLIVAGLVGVAHAAGPLAGWADVKRDYGAAGDGKVDDTAAIQRALDDLHQENRARHVLYFPAGTYRITRMIALERAKHAESMHTSIVGEDPAKAVLVWDGERGGTMLDYSAWYSTVRRLTFDGAKKAKTAIAHGKPFVTYNELSDLIIRDVDFGMEAGAPGGQGIAETAVLRCIFERCGKAGISIQNFNTLDWWIRDCRFEDCAIGVTNVFGAGNFHVYESSFARSKVADISIGNTGYFSFRFNRSVGSRAFFVAGGIGACAMTTIQGNTIVDSQETPIQVGNHGPILLIDNQIQYAKSPAVKVNPAAGFVSIGNTYTVENAVSAREGIRLEDHVGTIRDKQIALPQIAKMESAVIEVRPGSGGAEIQKIISNAIAEQKRVAMHLPAGKYAVDRTIEISAGAQVTMFGDGGYTQLNWTGNGDGPVIRIHGGEQVYLRDFAVDGARRADGIVIQECDRPGARLLMDQANVTGAKEVGFLAEGLENCAIRLENFEHGSCATGVRVVGRDGGKSAPVWIYGGASSNHSKLVYDVLRGGRLMVWDTWYETGQFPTFMRLADSGRFMLNGGIAALPQKDGRPGIMLDNFKGSAAFLATILVGGENKPLPVQISGDGKDTSLLLLGTEVGMGEGYLRNESPNARVALRESFMFVPGGGSKGIPDEGLKDAKFIAEMIRELRSMKRDDEKAAGGAGELNIHRVMVSNARTCIHVRP